MEQHIIDTVSLLLIRLPLVTVFFVPRQAWSFLSHLPVLEVEMSVKGWWEDSQEQTERPLPVAGPNLREESSWLDVHADQEYVLQVSLRRINLGQQRVSTLDAKTTFYQVIGTCH